MLAKKFRLSGFLVSQVFKKGKRFDSPLFTLKFLPLKEVAVEFKNFSKESLPIDHSLFSVTASLKVEKRAVRRNRIRRRIYEIVRLSLSKIKPGYAISFLTKKQILDNSYHQIEKEVLKALKENKLLLSS